MRSLGEQASSTDNHGPPQRRAHHIPGAAVPRVRRWAPKVKTGCVTCRARRIKCDETKPACTKCITSRRACGGYGSPESSISEQPTWSSAPAGLNPTRRERQVFQLLSTWTVRQVNGGIKSEFWTKNLLQATYVYPALWHAALALSAMHQRAAILLNGAQAHLAEDYFNFALREYTESIGYVIAMRCHGGLSLADQEMLLAASVLYIGICLLRADVSQAETHARNAVRLCCQWSYLDEKPELAASEGVLGRQNTVQLIRDVYHSFDSLGDTFPDETAIEFLTLIPHTTEPFNNIDEAYYAYLPIHAGSLKSKSWLPGQNAAEAVSPAPSEMLTRQHALNLWSIRFEGYLLRQSYSARDLTTIATLQLFRTFEETFDAVMIDRNPQTWAKHAHKWGRIVKAAEQLIKKHDCHGEPGDAADGLFFYSLSVLEVLRLTGFVCRHGALRRRIIELLKRWQHRDGVWDSHISWMMVETKMLIEEQTLAAVRPGSCECVPNLFFCADHRVSWTETQFLADGVVKLHMKTGVECRKGLPGHKRQFELR